MPPSQPHAQPQTQPRVQVSGAPDGAIRQANGASTEPTAAPKLPAAPQVRARRNPKWIALGVAALCLGALGALFLYTQLSHAQTVIAVRQTVHRGSVVSAGDLTTVTVGSTPGVRTVPGSQLSSLVGQRAAYDLVAGSLVTPDDVAATLVPAPGRSIVGIKLVAGRVPAGSLIPGTPVRLVAIPPTGSQPNFKDAYSSAVVVANVLSTVPGADGVSEVVNVDVGSGQAATVGLLAAQERLVIVQDAQK